MGVMGVTEVANLIYLAVGVVCSVALAVAAFRLARHAAESI